MTILGELFGYDRFGGDLFGVNKDLGNNCIVCGLSVYHHSDSQEKTCFLKYAQQLRQQRLNYYRHKYPKL